MASRYDLDTTSGEDRAPVVPEFTEAEWGMIESDYDGDWRAYLDAEAGEHDDTFDLDYDERRE